MANEEPIQLVLDIHGMQQRAYLGVRRAAAFLGISERMLEGELPRSLTLGRHFRQQFLPDPIPEEAIPELKESWRTWIVGNALRELDQFLSLYLDESFDITEFAKMENGERPHDHEWKRIDKTTNVAAKHRRVLEAANRFVAPHIDDHACLFSLSDARNCLSHDLGIVTPKRAKDGLLSVRWLGLRHTVRQGDLSIYLEEADMPFQPDPENGEASYCVRVEIVERSFTVGDHITLTPDDLLGICLFYNMVIDRVAQALTDYTVECGIPTFKPDLPTTITPPFSCL